MTTDEKWGCSGPRLSSRVGGFRSEGLAERDLQASSDSEEKVGRRFLRWGDSAEREQKKVMAHLIRH